MKPHFGQLVFVLYFPVLVVLSVSLDRSHCQRILRYCEEVVGHQQDALDVLLPDMEDLVVEHEAPRAMGDVDNKVVVSVFVDCLIAKDQLYGGGLIFLFLV